MKKILVIIAARGIGDLIYHLPLLRSLYKSYKKKIIILSNKVNHSKEVYKYESFYEEIIEFENTRLPFIETLFTIRNFTKLINRYKVDKVILTASPRRLMAPVYLSNAKEKVIFGGSKIFFFKDKKYQNITHAEKIMKYTEKLNLPINEKNFYLTQPDIKENDLEEKKFKVFINLDSHHDQNNWDIENYIKILTKIIMYNIKIFINFSPNKKKILSLLPKKIIDSSKINLTFEKKILDIIKIINSCNVIIGNESGPICLGASLKKEVHSIYLPIHTKPESQMISPKTVYYNVEKENDKIIIDKIMNSLLDNYNKQNF